MKVKHKILIATLLLIAVLIPQEAHAQANNLLVTWRFRVDKGSLDHTVLTIIKDGKLAKAYHEDRSGQMRLDLNSHYLFVFEKPGYVTKKIFFDTYVPFERREYGLAPFDFAVEIFPQYEGMNTMVFSQPVGRIYYDPGYEEFGYDMDYTRIIKSDLADLDDQLDEIEDDLEDEADEKGLSVEEVVAEKTKPKEQADMAAFERAHNEYGVGKDALAYLAPQNEERPANSKAPYTNQKNKDNKLENTHEYATGQDAQAKEQENAVDENTQEADNVHIKQNNNGITTPNKEKPSPDASYMTEKKDNKTVKETDGQKKDVNSHDTENKEFNNISKNNKSNKDIDDTDNESNEDNKYEQLAKAENTKPANEKEANKSNKNQNGKAPTTEEQNKLDADKEDVDNLSSSEEKTEAHTETPAIEASPIEATEAAAADENNEVIRIGKNEAYNVNVMPAEEELETLEEDRVEMIIERPGYVAYRTIIRKGRKVRVFDKVVHSWGPVFYFRDRISISEHAYKVGLQEDE